MERKKFKGLDLEIYEHTLNNGFKIYVCPMARYKIDARITVNVGGELETFKTEKGEITVPFGIAHFLEHKMFSKADGTDISSIYEKNGAFGNAYTDDYSTVYHFNSPVNFWDNLKALFRCVNEPYFTDENVQKEIGIIEQELMALLSDPDALVYFKAKYNSYHSPVYKYPVIGTLKSIKAITKEDLYAVYNAFYVPSNMHLMVTGNVKPEEVIKFAEDYYKDKETLAGEKIIPLEPPTICKKEEIIHKDINNKICFINYKVDISKFNLPNFELQRYLNVLILSKFSSLSGFNDIVLKNEKILSPVSWRLDVKGSYANFNFSAEAIDEKEVIDLIETRLDNLDIDEELLDLIKKNWINGYILTTDKVIPASTLINEQIIKYGEVIYDSIPIIKALNKDKAIEIFNKLDFSERTVAIVQK